MSLLKIIKMFLTISERIFEGMIVTSVKHLPLQLLATAGSDKAYYSEYGEGSDDFIQSRSEEEWMPHIGPGERLTVFVAGAPGAGKSYLAAELIDLLPPNSEVLLVTDLKEEDGNFAKFKGRLFKIRMDPENLDRLTLDAIRARCTNPVLLFDDVDKIRDKAVEKKTFALMEDALANGRGHKKHDGTGDVHVITTSHSLNDYKKTKYSLENSEYIAVFPRSTTYMQLRRLFEKIGLDKSMCDIVTELGRKYNVRRVIIHKNAPMYIIAGDLIKLI